mmetsp:Transcript_130705/g.297678  ORF Transcript_130705/g.297678 Transcript_130705/m.297678 type:complete len:226 (+) Transcript_130705:631-1308(+)
MSRRVVISAGKNRSASLLLVGLDVPPVTSDRPVRVVHVPAAGAVNVGTSLPVLRVTLQGALRLGAPRSQVARAVLGAGRGGIPLESGHAGRGDKGHLSARSKTRHCHPLHVYGIVCGRPRQGGISGSHPARPVGINCARVFKLFIGPLLHLGLQMGRHPREGGLATAVRNLPEELNVRGVVRDGRGRARCVHDALGVLHSGHTGCGVLAAVLNLHAVAVRVQGAR